MNFSFRGRLIFISCFTSLFFGLWMSSIWAGFFMMELLLFVAACLDYMKATND